MKGPRWECVSDAAKALTTKMLTYKPANRITAAQALADEWIESNIAASGAEQKVALNCLRNLQGFKVSCGGEWVDQKPAAASGYGLHR